jgi:hypothetical protein
MLSLVDGGDYIRLFVLTAVLGGVGGLAFDLLQVRGKDTGAIEKPTRLSVRYQDLGVFASIIIGAIAASAALWVFPPTERILGTTTVKEYGYDQLVPLALIVGSAGSSFLTAFQAKALARAKEQEAAETTRIANAALDEIASVEPGAPTTAGELSARVATAKRLLEALPSK